MMVENELIANAIVRAKAPLLSEAAKLIADPQVCNRGTIGGDIAHDEILVAIRVPAFAAA